MIPIGWATRLEVDMDVNEDLTGMFSEMWPEALLKLENIAERPAGLPMPPSRPGLISFLTSLVDQFTLIREGKMAVPYKITTLLAAEKTSCPECNFPPNSSQFLTGT